MRPSLRTWVADTDTRQNTEKFRLSEELSELGYLNDRTTDLYFSLVGELFDSLREAHDDQRDWATLGNALSQLAQNLAGVTQSDALFFSAAAFYSGGYSASAYLAMHQANQESWAIETYRACYDLLARSPAPASLRVRQLLAAVEQGRLDEIDQAVATAEVAAREALAEGPELWVAERVYSALVERFRQVNLRAVLPDGEAPHWNPLIRSFLNRSPAVWEFFPSQIKAIRAELLTSDETYSLQMPTGAGKTALTEVLIFDHLTQREGDLAVLLVPYRALARELRNSLAKTLNRINIPTKSVYGGTVPTRNEAYDLDSARLIIATPESLTGLLSAAPQLLHRITLTICDEGHLLDAANRGVGLELLLARLRSSERSRMVFLSAIVPNIEEINAWLGGSDSTVVRSEFRPADTEYAVLRPSGRGQNMTIDLEIQPLSTTLQPHALPGFLSADDFRYTAADTGRRRTHGFASIKTQAIATARKALALGPVAVFAATKTGNQGVVGLAEELLLQLRAGLPLPQPSAYMPDVSAVAEVTDYLANEYGHEWTGTRALQAGAVLHHGDIPQETREALEELVSAKAIQMVLCTSTLAEGVNLPLRTLVLYSVRRRSSSGQTIPMLARDIRNLVGRTGRAGISTRGLVVCANPSQWEDVAPVAANEPGENVRGALQLLLEKLLDELAAEETSLTGVLAEDPDFFPLVDGIDATLLELIQDEIGDDQFREIAASVAADTFAASQMAVDGQLLLANVFTLRATQIAGLRARGQLRWVHETGARLRLLESVVSQLSPSLENWDTINSPLDEQLLTAVLNWAYQQADFLQSLNDAYRVNEPPPVTEMHSLVHSWLSGETLARTATRLDLDIDNLLRIHSSVIAFELATLVEQGIALLARYFEDNARDISEAVLNLPQYLRFGVSTPAARSLLASGMRHRQAAVALGNAPRMQELGTTLEDPIELARTLLQDDERWRATLGEFVYERTKADLAEAESD